MIPTQFLDHTRVIAGCVDVVMVIPRLVVRLTTSAVAGFPSASWNCSLPPLDVRFYAAALASPKAKQTLGERHVIHLDVYRLRFHWPERLGKERQCTDCRLRVP